jgi:hypothetical protein
MLSTFSVTSTGDNGGVNPVPGAGTGTLRQAIVDANAAGGGTALNPDQIAFNIPTSDPGYQSSTGSFLIMPSSALPAITDPMVIDGWSQPGFTGSPLIVLSGSQAGGAGGLGITAGNTTIRGLVIDNFGGTAVYFSTHGGDVLQGCYIGTDGSGSVAQGNYIGVYVDNVGPVFIGGTTAAARNIISGSSYYGIILSGTGASGNVVEGNYIGTGASGGMALGNHQGGILVNGGAQDNRIGTDGSGPADLTERNVISGSSAAGANGIEIDGATTRGNVIAGNYIGTDASGTVALSNANIDIALNANGNFVGSEGTTGPIGPDTRNVISGHGFAGVVIGGSGNLVAGNYIGTDASGTHALGNSYGVFVSGGSGNVIGTNGDGNLISGNSFVDIWLDNASTNNVIAGDLIGTDVTGGTDKVALSENFAGIGLVHGSDNNVIGTGNTISGHLNYDIYAVGVSAETVAGNDIGTDKTGEQSLGDGNGVHLESSDQNVVDQNVISGFDGGSGVGLSGGASNNTIGGTTAAARNIIGKSYDGVSIAGTGTSGNLVEGNSIGTNGAGANLGNAQYGVLVSGGASNNQIGGAGTGAGNIIAYNAAAGVSVGVTSDSNSGVVGNAILGNSIYSNGGPGIALSTAAANDNQPAPLLSSFTATTDPTTNLSAVTITGSLSGARGFLPDTTYRIEYFGNNPGTGNQGQTIFGYQLITTDANGNAPLSARIAGRTIVSGEAATATATVVATSSTLAHVNDTSPFSAPTGAVVATVLPTVSFTSAGTTMYEPGTGPATSSPPGTVILTASLSATATQNVQVPISVASTTTALPSQYSGVPAFITIAAGQKTGQASFSIVHDGIAEPTDRLNIQMGTPRDSLNNAIAIPQGNTLYQVTIPANDTPLVSFTPSQPPVWEDSGTIAILLQLSNRSSQDVTIPLVVLSGGTAVQGTDYAFVSSQTVTIPHGFTIGNANIRINDSGANRLDRSFTLAFGPVAGASINSTGATRTITIQNDHPLVNFTTSTQDAFESVGATGIGPPVRSESTVTVHLLGANGLEKPTDHNVTVGLSILSNALYGTDYSLSPTTVVIPAGSTSAKIAFDVYNNGRAGLNKTVSLSLVQAYSGLFHTNPIPVNAIIPPTAKDVVTIINTNLPQVNFVTGGYTFQGFLNRGAVRLPFGVQLSAPSSNIVTVWLNPVNVEAIYGGDYTLPRLQIAFFPGTTLQTSYVTLQETSVCYNGQAKTFWLDLTSPTNATVGSNSAWDGIIYNWNSPPKVSPPYYVTQTGSKPPAATAGTLQIYTGRPISIPPPSIGSLTVVSGGGAPKIAAGQVALYGGFGGAISGATAFFDANMNGILDPGEPSTTTDADGYFALTIPSSFDLNNDGTIDPGEGQIDVVGGTDMATLLPQAGPLVTVPGAFVISPLTTLMASLMNSQGLSLTAAEDQVLQAFNLPQVDLTTFDPTQEILDGNADAVPIYAGIAKLEDTTREITDLVGAVPGAQPPSAVAGAVISSLAAAIADPGSTLDLDDSTALGAVIQNTLDQSGAALDPSVVAAAANIIAYGNQQIDAIPLSIDATYMTAVVQVQVVAQGTTAPQLADLAAGSTDSNTVTLNNTGTAFQNLVANAQTGNVVPPVLAIYDVSHVSSSTGQIEYDFTVGLSEPSVLPVSVDYSTYDGTATAANGDYLPTSGTLTWAPGDSSPRTIQVWVNPNTTFRPDEQFSVILFNAVNATTRRPVGTGVIVNQIPFDYSAPANNGNNNLDLQIDGSDVILTRNDQVVFSGPLTPTSPITITGADGVQTCLTVELLNDSTLPSAGLVFQGGSLGTDTLAILDASASSATQSPSGPGSGTFTIDGATVQYSNLASATDEISTFSPALQTTLTSSANPSVLSQPVTLTASLFAPSSGALAPTGSVDFFDTSNNTDLGTVALSGGVATLNISTLTLGTHVIQASYSGDSNYQPNEAFVTQTVMGTPTVAVTDAGGTYNGEPFAATATVAGVVAGVDNTPSSSLEGVSPTSSYYSGTYTSAAQLANLTPLSGLPIDAGSYTVLASFAGSADYKSATALASFTISKANQTITWATPSPILNGTALSGTQLDATVSVIGPAPAGALSYSPTAGTILAPGAQTLTVTAAATNDYNAATASVALTVDPTILVLDPTAGGALSVSSNASISLPTGNVIVDSDAKNALTESGNAQITAASIQVVGGVSKSGSAAINGTLDTGAATLTDPLAFLAGPGTTGLNSYGSASYSSGSHPLLPGIYSQISASGSASLALSPGQYLIKGGGFTVTGGASVSGSGITIYNTSSGYPASGNYGGITLSGNGTFSLTAATSATAGAASAYPGILIFQPGANTRAIALGGNGLLGLNGTIYAPTAQVTVSGNAQLSGALIADRLSLSGNGVSTQVADGSAGSILDNANAGALLAGNLAVYVSDPSGYFTADELSRIQDAINTWDSLLAPYNVTISEVTDPTLATVVIDNGTTSAAGSAANGVLGSYNSSGEITILQGWNWYGGADAGQIGSGQYDFQTVMTHELGHAVGLGGSPDSTSPMYEVLAAGVVRRTPTAPDLNIPEAPTGADPERAEALPNNPLPAPAAIPAAIDIGWQANAAALPANGNASVSAAPSASSVNPAVRTVDNPQPTVAWTYRSNALPADSNLGISPSARVAVPAADSEAATTASAPSHRRPSWARRGHQRSWGTTRGALRARGSATDSAPAGVRSRDGDTGEDNFPYGLERLAPPGSNDLEIREYGPAQAPERETAVHEEAVDFVVSAVGLAAIMAGPAEALVARERHRFFKDNREPKRGRS